MTYTIVAQTGNCNEINDLRVLLQAPVESLEGRLKRGILGSPPERETPIGSLVAGPGVAPGTADYESAVMLFHYPAAGCFFSFFFPKMRSQLSSNCLRGTLNGLGLLPLPPVLMIHFSKHDCSLECLPLDIPFDQQALCDSLIISVHEQSAHMEHREDASWLLLESSIPYGDYMYGMLLRN